jgi:hypothetical protein
MKIGICYVCPVVKWKEYEPIAHRFLASYRAFPPGHAHEFHLILNGGEPNPELLNLFSDMNPVCHLHDNSGWDIGAFQKIASVVDCDLMLFLGANTHFRRTGWLRRLIDGYEMFGHGLYGPSASFEISPHIRTTAFMCAPELVRGWTGKISRQKDRHEFEVGPTSITAAAMRQGFPCVLVCWDGFYLQHEWRKAPNIFRRGDQSNCLMFDRHHEIYESSTSNQKIRLGRIADGNEYERYRSAIQVRLAGWLK